MKLQTDPARVWKLLFFSLLAGYALTYAPYGINETDGGFITGLAWQVLQGKALYAETVYVRPPLPVWLRAAELALLPENGAILAERWLFYGKMGLCAWLAAATLLPRGERRWILAGFGFVVSVHSYTPMAWHTVDGILFGALACWLLFRVGWRAGAVLAGIAAVASALCKQSFYPLPVLLLSALALRRDWRSAGWFVSGAGLVVALFFGVLWQYNWLDGFLKMTTQAATGGQALQHGLLDYFRINPWVAAASGLSLPLVARWFWQNEPEKGARLAWTAWVAWLAALAGFYVRAVWLRQDFTAPFAQSRLLFDGALAFGVWQWWSGRWDNRTAAPFFALLGLSWCASISWGYNLPILFATPAVLAAMQVSEKLWRAAWPGRSPALPAAVAMALLVSVFRYGYEFVYRDGPRNGMTADLGTVFPALQGIRSDTTSLALYRDLHDLAGRYGPSFKTLPSFSQANFLTRTYPPLPLDWLVRRENNGDNTLVMRQLEQNKPVFFIEKSYGRDRIENDPELGFTRKILLEGRLVAETPHFWVVRYE